MEVRGHADAALPRPGRRLPDLKLRALALSALALLAMGAVAVAGGGRPGSAGVGDPFFPLAGNGGYDALRYDLRLAYRPNSGFLRGRARITARAERPLRSFHLDLRGFTVQGIDVNGDRAAFRRRGQELIVTSSRVLQSGKQFSVTVSYRGRPRAVTDPDGSREGWLITDDGALVVSEPQGAPTWFPCNDHPSDKAAYRFELTVPAALHAVANGRLRSVTKNGVNRTWLWQHSLPMATYLATVNIGRGAVRRIDAAGIPSWISVDPREAEGSRRVLRRLPRVIAFLRRRFGTYPFGASGAIVDHANVGFSLETQTRPTFTEAPDIDTLVHEIAHEWFGNSVTLRRWPQIWLHEGFATWAEWFWRERHGGPSARATLRSLYATPASDAEFWNPPPGRPGRAPNLFDQTIYTRGAMAIQALRQRVGGRDFFGILRRWTRSRRHENGTISQFISLSEQNSGRSLDRLFGRWLFEPGKPRSQPAD